MAQNTKADITRNSEGLQEAIERITLRERFPLRIDSRTVILVSKEKCNKAYAEEYRRRMEHHVISGQLVDGPKPVSEDDSRKPPQW